MIKKFISDDKKHIVIVEWKKGEKKSGRVSNYSFVDGMKGFGKDDIVEIVNHYKGIEQRIYDRIGMFGIKMYSGKFHLLDDNTEDTSENDILYSHDILNPKKENIKCVSQHIDSAIFESLPNPYSIKPRYRFSSIKNKVIQNQLRNKSGIYFLFNDFSLIKSTEDSKADIKKIIAELTYIGYSKNLLSRLRNHKSNKSIPSTLFAWVPFEDEVRYKVVEHLYIEKYKPKYNKII